MNNKMKTNFNMKTLELNQMGKISGGVSVEEYCKTLKILMDNPDNYFPDAEFWYSGFGCRYFE